MSTGDYPRFDYIRQCLEYRDGKLFWKVRPREHFVREMDWKAFNTRRAGKEAGCVGWFGEKGNQYERCLVKLDQKSKYRYQFIYAIFHNKWVEEIDHKDLNTLNDKIDNLRECTSSQNKGNTRINSKNTSGHKGVSFVKSRNQWKAYMKINGVMKNLGNFDEKEVAIAVREAAAKKHFGEFYRQK